MESINFKLYKENSNSNRNILLLKSSDQEEIIKTCREENYNVYSAIDTNSAIKLINDKNIKFVCVIAAMGVTSDDNYLPLLKENQLKYKHFFIIFSHTASKNAKFRQDCVDEGANMVTCCHKSLKEVLNLHNKINYENNKYKGKKLTCPYCKVSDFSEDGLWHHMPLYHIVNKKKSGNDNCELCQKKVYGFFVHYRNNHGPCGRGEIINENHPPVELYCFALAVVYNKKLDAYLLVHEYGNNGFWLPGGRTDPGEELIDSAIRETKEEGGIDIDVKGILTIEFNHGHGRLRAIFYAEPIDDNQLPKSIPDFESAGASYVKAQDIEKLKLRGYEPYEWITNYVDKKKTIYPLTILGEE